MLHWQIRTTFSHPEQLREIPDETGRVSLARVPQHPTRPARAWEPNSWWEEIDYADVLPLIDAGATVRLR